MFREEGVRAATLLERTLWHRCFHVNFAKFLGTPFLTEHLRWLLRYSACRLQNFRETILHPETPFMDQCLSKCQCGFRKGFNALHCLLAILGKWKKAGDTKKGFGALLLILQKHSIVCQLILLLLNSMLVDLAFLH